MLQEKAPVTLLTGFLGSGKTTFLNAFMEYKAGRRFAIIENEVGEQGIDGALVTQADDNLMEMNDGCLCCSLNGNLFDILNDLYQRKDEWDELIIEATGIAEPDAIAAPFLKEPVFQKHFDLKRVICLADAGQIKDAVAKETVAGQQLAYADMILLNKIDTVANHQLTDLQHWLAMQNPLAKVFTGYAGHYPIGDMISYETDTLGMLQSSDNHVEETDDHGHNHEGIDAHTFTFQADFDIDRLTNVLTSFLTFQAQGVYRLKGVVYDSYKGKSYIIQSVTNKVKVEEMEPKAYEGQGEVESQIVIIGRNLKPEGYQKVLKKGIRKNLV